MNFLWQHWVAAILLLAVGMYIGRKTTLLSGVPFIGQ